MIFPSRPGHPKSLLQGEGVGDPVVLPIALAANDFERIYTLRDRRTLRARTGDVADG